MVVVVARGGDDEHLTVLGRAHRGASRDPGDVITSGPELLFIGGQGHLPAS